MYGSKCCGYSKCCCPVPLCPSSPPNVAGPWNITLVQLIRPFGATPVTCADVTDVTETQQFQLTFTQCDSPNNPIVTAVVQSGPAGTTTPFAIGDQLIGVFGKQGSKCWNLKLVSSVDNSVLDINFIGNYNPRRFNYSYYKPVDPSLSDSSAVGFGSGTKA